MSGKVTEAVVAKIEMPTELVKEEEIQQNVSMVEVRAKAMTITSNEDYEKLPNLDSRLKLRRKW